MTISTIMLNILERLSEMFPLDSYQSRLEAYIESRNPQSPADIEQYSREYNQKISQGGWL